MKASEASGKEGGHPLLRGSAGKQTATPSFSTGCQQRLFSVESVESEACPFYFISESAV